jgi:hypothetical protein
MRLHCTSSPRCEHHWFYDFRVNRRRYRQTTETANKRLAKSIEAKERARVLEGRHGIRQQPDITFKAFAEIYIRDHAELHKRSVEREILKVLNRAFGSRDANGSRASGGGTSTRARRTDPPDDRDGDRPTSR